MNERWVCKRCFADNDETNAACARCGLIRGAEATDADQAGWTAAGPTAEPQTSAGGGLTRWLRYWWIPAIVIALAVGYFTNARRGDDGGITEGGTLHVQDLRVGDCFNSAETDEISEVDARPCTDTHEYELYHVATYPGSGEFPAEDTWLNFIIDECTPAFASYVGLAYEASVLEIQPLSPTEAGWDDGDKVVQCLLLDPDDQALTASMRDANR